MIQRIQSVYLFVSLCFMLPMFFLPVAELLLKTGEIFTFNFTGFYLNEAGVTTRINTQWSILLFGMLICALNFIIIFLYKSRVLQIRLSIYNILFLIGLTGIIIFTAYNVQNVETVSFRLPIVFPVIAVILHYLAFRAIRKDEIMVQALNRLR